MTNTTNDNPSKGEQQENQKEWEIGIRAWGSDDDPGEARWEHYHPEASDEDAAIEKEAQSGLNSLVGMQDAFEVYMVEGPFEVDHAG
jgi:hypothetical protein